tara:strand:- start:482 stop:787 length:306 start_codon:yes stop_codon:yes gene_type:complete
MTEGMSDQGLSPTLRAHVEGCSEAWLIQWLESLLQALSLKTHAPTMQVLQAPRNPQRVLTITTEMQDLTVNSCQDIGADPQSALRVEIGHSIDQPQTTLLN